MPRNILERIELPDGKGKVKQEFKPGDRLLDSKLLKGLMDFYMFEGFGVRQFPFGMNYLSTNRFVVGELEHLIKGADIPEPQFLINALTRMLEDVPESILIPRTEYLSAAVQTLYNLGYGEDFEIDIKGWPGDEHSTATFLDGHLEYPPTLTLRGNFSQACVRAGNCRIIVYDTVELCGYHAKNTTFCQMPDARIKRYRARQSDGNVWMKMDNKGEWEILG